jgi:hypothetical protein
MGNRQKAIELRHHIPRWRGVKRVGNCQFPVAFLIHFNFYAIDFFNKVDLFVFEVIEGRRFTVNNGLDVIIGKNPKSFIRQA